MTDYLDMVQRKSAVDQAMTVWDERRAAEWKLQDDNWEKEYDARIVREQREAEEEKARWESLTEEERKAELDDLDEFAFAFDSDSEDDSDDEEDDVDLTFMEEEKTLTPDEKKTKEWNDYKRDSKEWREKRRNEVWNAMLYCSWPQLRKYRSELGLSNEHFIADTFL